MKEKETETEEVGPFQVERKETGEEERCPGWKSQTQRRRNAIPGGKVGDNLRGRHPGDRDYLGK